MPRPATRTAPITNEPTGVDELTGSVPATGPGSDVGGAVVPPAAALRLPAAALLPPGPVLPVVAAGVPLGTSDALDGPDALDAGVPALGRGPFDGPPTPPPPGAVVRGAAAVGTGAGTRTVGFGPGLVIGAGGGAGAAGAAMPGRPPAPNAQPSTEPGAGLWPAAPVEL